MNRYSKRICYFRSYFPKLSFCRSEKPVHFFPVCQTQLSFNIFTRSFHSTDELLSKRNDTKSKRDKSSIKRVHDVQRNHNTKGGKAKENIKKATVNKKQEKNPIREVQQSSNLFKGIKVMPSIAIESENLGEELAGKLDKSKLFLSYLQFSF